MSNMNSSLIYPSVENIIAQIAPRLEATPELLRIFKQCYPNTLETTVELLDDNTTFVITGDIEAMWLRDSAAQVRPYVHLAAQDSALARMIAGVIRRHAFYIAIDPYSNTFNKTANAQGHQTDGTVMQPWLWERKYELDSLCYTVQLLQDYWSVTQDRQIFDESIHQMLHIIVNLMQIEQHHDEQSTYQFERGDDILSIDTLPFAGRGTRTNFTGMVWSGFRPSDDSCKFGYLIPANMFAVVILGYILFFSEEIYKDADLRQKVSQLRREIDFGIQTYGIVNHPRYGQIYAYETDGYGNYNLMDDANVPNLLSIPYLGYRSAYDPIYINTRRFILSKDNPYYFEGKYAKGIGSPHTPYGYIWHIGLIMQALTAIERQEQDEIVRMLITTTAGTGFMHESFNPNNPEAFTRSWFAWANSLFGQFICQWMSNNSK